MRSASAVARPRLPWLIRRNELAANAGRHHRVGGSGTSPAERIFGGGEPNPQESGRRAMIADRPGANQSGGDRKASWPEGAGESSPRSCDPRPSWAGTANSSPGSSAERSSDPPWDVSQLNRRSKSGSCNSPGKIGVGVAGGSLERSAIWATKSVTRLSRTFSSRTTWRRRLPEGRGRHGRSSSDRLSIRWPRSISSRRRSGRQAA